MIVFNIDLAIFLNGGNATQQRRNDEDSILFPRF